MKKLALFFLLVISLFYFTTFAQSSGYVDSTGLFHWQYHRSVYKNAEDTTTAVVVVVFINGSQPSAVSYRQETKSSTIKWLEKENGTIGQDGYVQYITTKLEPYQAVVWRFIVKNKEFNKDRTIDLEEGAILIMDQNFVVKKEKFAEQKVK